MQERREAGKEGCMKRRDSLKEGMHEKKEAGKEGCRKKGIKT